MENNKENDFDKVDFLWKVIVRYDHYINTTNTKASLIIAWNGIVIGAVLLQYKYILEIFSIDPHGKIIALIAMFLLGFTSLISNLIIFGVVTPYMPNSDNSTSLIYFSSVSKMDQENYHNFLDKSDNNSIIADLSLQATELAAILETKMKKTRKSIICMYIGLVIIYLMFACITF